MLFGLDPFMALLRLLALIPALVGHEFAHGYSAYKMGDPTPKMQGRLTLNPIPHLDPFGTLMILFGPIGWAKPVQVNPYNFRDPAKGMMISTACGPLSNIAQGIVVGLVLRVALTVMPARGNILIGYLAFLVLINFVLAFFNLIPLGPLDGHHILEYFLPYNMKQTYRQFNQFGMFILLGLIVLAPGVFQFIMVPARLLARLAVGHDIYRVLGMALGG